MEEGRRRWEVGGGRWEDEYEEEVIEEKEEVSQEMCKR